MIKLTIGTTTERKSVLAEANIPLRTILEDNNVSTMGAAMHLNGNLIPGVALGDTLEQLGVADGSDAMLIAVVKADSAR